MATPMLATGVLAAGGLALGSADAGATLNVRVTNTGGEGVSSRSAPQVAARNGYGAPEGASVSTVCFTWGDAVGPYNNRLWWLVSYSGRQFYIADRYLSTPNRANEPPAGETQCGVTAQPPAQTSAQKAVQWARSHVGAVDIPASERSGNPDATTWPGWCYLFVYDAYTIGAGVNGLPRGTAAQVLATYTSRGMVRTGPAPAGAMVFWAATKSNSAGHVALSTGDGNVIGTQGFSGRLPVAVYSAAGNAGWVLP